MTYFDCDVIAQISSKNKEQSRTLTIVTTSANSINYPRMCLDAITVCCYDKQTMIVIMLNLYKRTLKRLWRQILYMKWLRAFSIKTANPELPMLPWTLNIKCNAGTWGKWGPRRTYTIIPSSHDQSGNGTGFRKRWRQLHPSRTSRPG
jgi:hypothetical protein